MPTDITKPAILNTTPERAQERILHFLNHEADEQWYADKAQEYDISPWQAEMVIRYYIGGEAIRAIAKAFHINERRIKDALQDKNVIAFRKDVYSVVAAQWEPRVKRLTQLALDNMEQLLTSPNNWREKYLIARDLLKTEGLINENKNSAGSAGVSINLNFNSDNTLRNVTAENKEIEYSEDEDEQDE